MTNKYEEAKTALREANTELASKIEALKKEADMFEKLMKSLENLHSILVNIE